MERRDCWLAVFGGGVLKENIPTRYQQRFTTMSKEKKTKEIVDALMEYLGLKLMDCTWCKGEGCGKCRGRGFEIGTSDVACKVVCLKYVDENFVIDD